jgi:tRNA(Ile)-lysidine synthase
MSIVGRVANCLAELGLLADARLVIGVSGGADSLALLHALREVLGGERLMVAHLNHGWRKTAVLDAQFVTQTAANWGLLCAVETVDTPALAQHEGLSLEEAGRLARYRFFARLATEWGATAVTVAHTADDQAETVLLHLLRGSGLAGLGGMKAASPMPEAPRITLLRPLLGVSRAEVETYCREQGLTPRQDATNDDTRYRRNRIRHELLPALADYNPQIHSHLRHLAEIAAADDAALEELVTAVWPTLSPQQGEGWISLDRPGWLSLPLGLRRRVLRRAVAAQRPFLPDISFPAIEQARLVAERGHTGAQSDLAAELSLRVVYGRLLISQAGAAPAADWPQLPPGATLPLPVPGRVSLPDGWQIEAAPLTDFNLADIQSNQDLWLAYVVGGADLWLRGRLPGERFQPLGLGGHSASLKEVMVNRRIAADFRANWPLVANERHLVWLVGHLLDERVKVTGGETAVVRLRCYKS